MTDAKRRRGWPVGAVILIGIGFLFLLNNFDVLSWGMSWPLILIIVGIAIIVGRPRKGS